jgi:hypothetical protein
VYFKTTKIVVTLLLWKEIILTASACTVLLVSAPQQCNAIYIFSVSVRRDDGRWWWMFCSHAVDNECPRRDKTAARPADSLAVSRCLFRETTPWTEEGLTSQVSVTATPSGQSSSQENKISFQKVHRNQPYQTTNFKTCEHCIRLTHQLRLRCSLELSHFWETDSSPARKGILHLLWNPRARYCLLSWAGFSPRASILFL